MLSSDLKYMLSMSDKREWQKFITWIDAQVELTAFFSNGGRFLLVLDYIRSQQQRFAPYAEGQRRELSAARGKNCQSRP